MSGRPGPPSAPIKFEEIGAERITLSWLPPKDDGGSRVTNYVIWRRVANRKTWVPVTNEPKDRIWTVENLMAGHEYVFRIMAQNKYGVGDPLDSDPEVARNLYSEFQILVFKRNNIKYCMMIYTSVHVLVLYINHMIPQFQCRTAAGIVYQLGICHT